jgi:hypothetical protein
MGTVLARAEVHDGGESFGDWAPRVGAPRARLGEDLDGVLGDGLDEREPRFSTVDHGAGLG